jgi:magnesium transporter
MKRTLLDFISRDMARLSEEDPNLYYVDIKDHLEKVLESLNEAKETIEIYKDADYMLSTEKSNKRLGILTIVFTYTDGLATLTSIFLFYQRKGGLSVLVECSWVF